MFFTRCVAEYLNEQEKAKALKYNMRRGILFKLTVGKKVHVVTMLHQDPSWSSLPNRKPQ